MYQESERQIFGPFFDGRGPRHADPLAVERKLRLLLGPDPELLLKQYASPLAEEALPAAVVFFNALAYAFEVQAFDPATGQGLLENELVALWNAFQEFRKKKVTSTANCPTSSPSTAGAGPANPSTITPTAGWSSIMGASASDGPGSSRTGST